MSDAPRVIWQRGGVRAVRLYRPNTVVIETRNLDAMGAEYWHVIGGDGDERVAFVDALTDFDDSIDSRRMHAASFALALAFLWVSRQANKDEAGEMVHWAIAQLPSDMPKAEDVFLEAETMDREDT